MTATATETVKPVAVKQTLGDLAAALRPIVTTDCNTDCESADSAKAYVAAIADYLGSNSKRFDRGLFFSACGLNPRG